jgi:hypothetical protein
MLPDRFGEMVKEFQELENQYVYSEITKKQLETKIEYFYSDYNPTLEEYFQLKEKITSPDVIDLMAELI